jgi:translation initiation factor 3 subunit C
MLLELPSLARPNVTSSQYIISKAFRKYFQAYNRQLFAGPPEYVRDYVLLSTKSILRGDWRKACDLLLNLEAWNLIPGDGGSKVKSMLQEKIKEEAIKTYLLTFCQHYESVSIAHLGNIFEVDTLTIQRIASKMIYAKELSAALDQTNGVLVMYAVDATPLQMLTLQIAERLSGLAESNERLLDPLLNPTNPKDEWRNPLDKKYDQTDRRKYPGFRSARPSPARGFQSNPRTTKTGGRGGMSGGRNVWGKYGTSSTNSNRPTQVKV